MFMLHDIADSTRTQCLRSAFAFTRWSLHNGLTSGTTLRPPSARTLVFHASWRAAQGNSVGYMRSCLSGVAACFEWHYHDNILRDSKGDIHRDLSRVLRGIARVLSKKTEDRLPLTMPLMNRC
jgi:hypothetical protein